MFMKTKTITKLSIDNLQIYLSKLFPILLLLIPPSNMAIPAIIKTNTNKKDVVYAIYSMRHAIS